MKSMKSKFLKIKDKEINNVRKDLDSVWEMWSGTISKEKYLILQIKYFHMSLYRVDNILLISLQIVNGDSFPFENIDDMMQIDHNLEGWESLVRVGIETFLLKILQLFNQPMLGV